MSGAEDPRVAIVTGAAGGIGSATVRQLLADGLTVAAVDVDERGLGELRERLGTPARLATFAFDATAEAEAGVRGVIAQVGAPYALVNNAGVMHEGDALSTSDADWEHVLGHDLTGPFRMCREVLPAMLAAGRGTIVNVASIAGVIGFRNRLAYSSAKAGLLGLTRALSADHAPAGIRINAVNPGTTESPMTRAIIERAEDPERQRRFMAERQPIGQMGRPEDVAAAIAFLVGDGSVNVTGSEITVDGGFSVV